jgi:predicted DNA-binding WGR domain protein
MTCSERPSLHLVGYEGGGRTFWRAERNGTSVELHHGAIDTAGKRESRTFANEAAARAFFSRQAAIRIDRGYHAELPFQILRWAEVRDEVSPRLAGNSESDDDRVLVHDGDLTVPHALWLDYRRGLLALADENEPAFAGVLVRGNLTIEGCLVNYEDDYGPFLLVTGDLTAPGVATGGSQICVRGALTAETVVGVYNHGSLVAHGPLRAKVVASEHTIEGGPLDAIRYHGWGRNALPTRDGVVDASEPYEPRNLFVSAVMKGGQVDLGKARQLLVAGKPIVKSEPLSVRAAFRKLVGKKLAEPDKVKSLSLEGKDLTFLPEEIFAFRKLEKLTLKRNKLRLLPEELGRLTELRELDVSSNGLQELPESIGQLGKLRSLVLSANCLWRLPASLASCTELRTINLTNNPYSYVRASFGSWDKVQLMWDLPEVLTRLPRLEELIFDGTFVRNLPARRFDSPHLHRAVIKSSLVLEVDAALHDQLAIDVAKSPERAVNYIRYWFDNDEIHLEHFYDARRDTYDLTQVLALFGLLLRIVIPTAAPYTAAIATFEKQCLDVIRGLAWGGKNVRHVQTLFRALGESLAGFEQTYPGNPLLAGLRPMFAKHAGTPASEHRSEDDD